MATLVGTRPPTAASHPRLPTRLLLILAAIVAGNLVWYFGANALLTIDQIPDTGRDALHKLLLLADVGIGLFIVAEWMGPRLRYFTRRMVLGALTVFIIVALVYFVLNAIPGEKWYSHLLNVRNQTPAQIALIMHHYGIDRPVYVQFLGYLNQLIAIPPDLGYSSALSQTVWDAISTHIGPTAVLMTHRVGHKDPHPPPCRRHHPRQAVQQGGQLRHRVLLLRDLDAELLVRVHAHLRVRHPAHPTRPLRH